MGDYSDEIHLLKAINVCHRHRKGGNNVTDAMRLEQSDAQLDLINKS